MSNCHLCRTVVYETIGEREIDSQQADNVELQENAAYCSQRVQLQQNESYVDSTENDNKEPVYVNNSVMLYTKMIH